MKYITRELGAGLDTATKLSYACFLKAQSKPNGALLHRAAWQSYCDWRDTQERVERMETAKRLARLQLLERQQEAR